MVGTPSGAHSRDPLALPTLRLPRLNVFVIPGRAAWREPGIQRYCIVSGFRVHAKPRAPE
jgi:hypothetical protein